VLSMHVQHAYALAVYPGVDKRHTQPLRTLVQADRFLCVQVVQKCWSSSQPTIVITEETEKEKKTEKNLLAPQNWAALAQCGEHTICRSQPMLHVEEVDERGAEEAPETAKIVHLSIMLLN
jgi:hypothetical protein